MCSGGEACERLTTLGIAVNLVTYLTGTMHLGNATSANAVTNFLGTSFMLCLLGGFVADTFLGRFGSGRRVEFDNNLERCHYFSRNTSACLAGIAPSRSLPLSRPS